MKNKTVLILSVFGLPIIVVVGVLFFINQPNQPSNLAESVEDSVVAESNNILSQTLTKNDSHSDKSVEIIYRNPADLGSVIDIVQFPTGDSIEVTYQRYEIEPLPIVPTRQLVDMYNALEQAASDGDGDAAYFLHASTKICSAAARTEAERDRRIKVLLTEQHAYVSSREDSDSSIELIDVEPNEFELYQQRIYGRFDYCQKLGDEQVENPSKWLDRAIELGNHQAISRAAVANPGTEDSFLKFKKLWDDGYVDNGHALAINYQQGIPTENGRQSPDYVSAYAYAVAMNAVWKQAIIRSNPPDLANKIAAIDSSTQSMSGYLSPSEQKIADELAISLIKDHPKCCLSNW